MVRLDSFFDDAVLRMMMRYNVQKPWRRYIIIMEERSFLEAAHSSSETAASSAERRRCCRLNNNFFNHFWDSDNLFFSSYHSRSWRFGSTSLILSPRDGVADRAEVSRAVRKTAKTKIVEEKIVVELG